MFQSMLMLLLLLPAAALAAGPTVPDSLLRALPADVLETLAFQEEHVASFDELIAARQQAAAEAHATHKRLEAEVAKIRAAGGDPKLAPVAAQAKTVGRLPLARMELDRAQAALSKAERTLEMRQGEADRAKEIGNKEALNAASGDLKNGKRDVVNARKEVAFRAKALKKVEAEIRRVPAAEREQVAQVRAVAQEERSARAEAKANAAIAEGEIKLFEAERILAAAELEVARAKAVNQGGRKLDLKPYEAARDEARELVATERKRMEALRASLGIYGR